jgi:hypothetical protein
MNLLEFLKTVKKEAAEKELVTVLSNDLAVSCTHTSWLCPGSKCNCFDKLKETVLEELFSELLNEVNTHCTTDKECHSTFCTNVCKRHTANYAISTWTSNGCFSDMKNFLGKEISLRKFLQFMVFICAEKVFSITSVRFKSGAMLPVKTTCFSSIKHPFLRLISTEKDVLETASLESDRLLEGLGSVLECSNKSITEIRNSLITSGTDQSRNKLYKRLYGYVTYFLNTKIQSGLCEHKKKVGSCEVYIDNAGKRCGEAAKSVLTLKVMNILVSLAEQPVISKITFSKLICLKCKASGTSPSKYANKYCWERFTKCLSNLNLLFEFLCEIALFSIDFPKCLGNPMKDMKKIPGWICYCGSNTYPSTYGHGYCGYNGYNHTTNLKYSRNSGKTVIKTPHILSIALQ